MHVGLAKSVTGQSSGGFVALVVALGDNTIGPSMVALALPADRSWFLARGLRRAPGVGRTGSESGGAQSSIWRAWYGAVHSRWDRC